MITYVRQLFSARSLITFFLLLQKYLKNVSTGRVSMNLLLCPDWTCSSALVFSNGRNLHENTAVQCIHEICHVPGSRMPEARHSMTRRRASPAPRGLLQVAIAFSQMSSNGCRSRHRWMCNMQRNEGLTLYFHVTGLTLQVITVKLSPILLEVPRQGVYCTCL